MGKMKVTVAAILAGSATAFAPSAQVSRSSVATNMAFESELGVQPPLGFFDPLGLLDDADQEKFDRLRYVELKHGRISMLAFLGQILNRAGVHFGGDIDYSGTSFASIPSGFKAIPELPTAGIYQMIAFVGFLEVAVMKDVTGEGEFDGD